MNGENKKSKTVKWGALLCAALFVVGGIGTFFLMHALNLFVPAQQRGGYGPGGDNPEWYATTADTGGNNLVGNSAFLRQEGGLLAAQGNTVFFANPQDAQRLYMADKNGESLRKLTDFAVANINVAGNRLVFTDMSDSLIFRTTDQGAGIAHIAADSLDDIAALLLPNDDVRLGGRMYIVDGVLALMGGDDSQLTVTRQGGETYSVYQPLLAYGQVYCHVVAYDDAAAAIVPQTGSTAAMLPLAAALSAAKPRINHELPLYYDTNDDQVMLRVGDEPVFLTESGQYGGSKGSVVVGNMLLMTVTNLEDGQHNLINCYDLENGQLKQSIPGAQLRYYQGAAIIQNPDNRFLYAYIAGAEELVPVSTEPVNYFGINSNGELAYSYNDNREIAILSNNPNREKFPGGLAIPMEGGFYAYTKASPEDAEGTLVPDGLKGYEWDDAQGKMVLAPIAQSEQWNPLEWLKNARPDSIKLTDRPPIQEGERSNPGRAGEQIAAAVAKMSQPHDYPRLPDFYNHEQEDAVKIFQMMLAGGADLTSAHFQALIDYYGFDGKALVLESLQDYGTPQQREELAGAIHRLYYEARYDLYKADDSGASHVLIAPWKWSNWRISPIQINYMLARLKHDGWNEEKRNIETHKLFMRLATGLSKQMVDIYPWEEVLHTIELKRDSQLGWVVSDPRALAELWIRNLDTITNPPPPVEPVEMSAAAALEAYIAYLQGGDASHPKIAAVYQSPALFDEMVAFYGKSPQEIFYQALAGMTNGVRVSDKEAAYRPLAETFGAGILGLFTYTIDGEEAIASSNTVDVTLTSTKRAQWGSLAGVGESLSASIAATVSAAFDATITSDAEKDRHVQETIRGLLADVVAERASGGEITFNSDTQTLSMAEHPTLGYVLRQPMNLIFHCMLPGAVISYR